MQSWTSFRKMEIRDSIGNLTTQLFYGEKGNQFIVNKRTFAHANKKHRKPIKTANTGPLIRVTDMPGNVLVKCFQVCG